jgi:DNA-binding HxlR family transcriptional regulator
MPKRHASYCGAGCPVEAALEVIRGKWQGGILYHLAGGPRRFADLERLMPDVTQRILIKALRELEADGIVVRTVTPLVPPRVDYALSARGETLRPVFASLADWGREVIRGRDDRRPIAAE